MTVRYRGNRVLITDEMFEVDRPFRRYEITGLSEIHIIQHRLTAGGGAQRVMGVSAMVGALVVVPVIGAESHLLAGLVTAALLVYGAFCLRTMPRGRWELVAMYRGNRIVLVGSTDRVEFEQICRGLQRSLEYNGER